VRPEKALELIDHILAEVPATREQHEQIREAIEALAVLLEKQTKEERTLESALE